MDFLLLDSEMKEKYSSRIIEMMELSDNDFIPPLSQRSSTTQSNLSGEKSAAQEKSVLPYFNEMIKQPILGVIEDGQLIGFMAYKENMPHKLLCESDFPNIYLSTMVLHPNARGKGVATGIYQHLVAKHGSSGCIYTRTWSTNVPHLKILNKMGFELWDRIPNDRGEGIDTVYYGRRAK